MLTNQIANHYQNLSEEQARVYNGLRINRQHPLGGGRTLAVRGRIPPCYSQTSPSPSASRMYW